MKKLVCALFFCSLFLGGCCHHKCVENRQEQYDSDGKSKNPIMKLDEKIRENVW